jgi:hypothetical protein
MPADTAPLPPPTHHVFVDFENVHKIDLALIGGKAVSLTLLLGSQQTKLDVALIEKLLEHADSVHLVRLTSPGRNALDFTLAYYVGRAVAADPTAFFHIVSKDTGFDPLVEHLRSKHINAQRHNDFLTLTVSGPAKPAGQAPPAPAPGPKSESKPPPGIVDGWEQRVLEHLAKPSTKRPRNHKKLISYLVTHLAHKITEAQAMEIIESLRQAGRLDIDTKGAVTYHLEPQ